MCVQRICQAYRGEQSLLRRARGRKARTKLVWSSIPLLLRVHGTQNTECCAEDLLLVPSCCATCSHQVASAALLWLLWAFLRALLGQHWDLLSPHSLHAAPLDTGVCLVTGSLLSLCPCLRCSLQRKLSHSVSRGEDSLIYHVVSHGAVFLAAASNLTSSHLWIPGANGVLSATIGNRVEILLQVLEKWFLAHFEPRPHPRVRQNFI